MPCTAAMMSIVLMGLLLGLGIEAGGAGEPGAASDGPVSVEPFHELMRTLVVEHDVPGAALCVSRQGRHILDTGYGLADVREGRAVSDASRFRIASISKPLTAVAVLQLVERGRLDLDANPFEVIGCGDRLADDGVDPRLREVTVRQLLHHSAGWNREESFDPMFIPDRVCEALGAAFPPDQQAIIRYMMGHPLQSDPGSRYAYSNFGYCILGRVIEAASGQAYETYVFENVCRPLRMISTRIGQSLPEDRQAQEVVYYAAGGGQGSSHVARERTVPKAYALDVPVMDAHGGWISTASDLVRFADAFNDPEACAVLSAASIELMFAPPPAPLWRDDDGRLAPAYYAMGWMVRPVGDGAKANTWHAGRIAGTSTLLVRRHDGLNWAVLANTDRTGGGEPVSSVIDPLVHRAAARVAWGEP